MDQTTAQTLDDQLQIAKEHLLEYIEDDTHFTARWLTALKEKTSLNVDEETLAKICVNLFCIWLTISDRAEFATNFILVGVPLLLFFVYPDEKASDEDMLIYWPCYAIVTLFDFLLQAIPAWFSLKLLLFALFFLRPWRLVQKIRQWLMIYRICQVAADVSRRVHEVPQVPDDMLSRILAAQDVGPNALRAQLPPSSLLVSPPGPTSSTVTAAQTNASAERLAQQAAAATGESQQQQYVQSHYVNLRPKSQPKPVDPQQSQYVASHPRAQAAKSSNAEDQQQ